MKENFDLLVPPPRNPRLAHARRQQGIPGFAAMRGRGRETGVPCAPSPLRALPGRPAGAAGTPNTHCACAGVVSTGPGLSRRARVEEGKAAHGAHASTPARPPALWARESSPAALRTGGGAGKPAQTGVGFAEAWAGEGASVGSSPGSRSRRRLGNRARGPQCGGGGSLGETEWFCACVGLRACGRGSPSCSWGRSIGGGGGGG